MTRRTCQRISAQALQAFKTAPQAYWLQSAATLAQAKFSPLPPVSDLGIACYTPKHSLRHSPVLTLMEQSFETHAVFDTLLTYSLIQVCCRVFTQVVFQVCPTHTVFECVHILSVDTLIHRPTHRVWSECITQNTPCVQAAQHCRTLCVLQGNLMVPAMQL